MRCFACSRDTSDGDYVLVRFVYVTVRCCSTCYERGEEGIAMGLDYTEEDPHLNREGMPEFNGAFG